MSPQQPTNPITSARPGFLDKGRLSGVETTQVLSPAQMLLEELLLRSIILSEEWEAFSDDVAASLRLEENRDKLLQRLAALKMLTPYQAERIHHGNWGGLILGNYRVLEKLGAGGMGTVFKAEHLLMRHLAALKILPQPFEGLETLPRFLAEIRHVTALHHPNIVAALDAGRTLPTEWENPNWYYLVMEYVPGSNLEKYVQSQGPLAPAKACDLICQVASGLAEAHRHEIIHRDIKPSNILVTPDGQAKLTDFGLSRAFQERRMTKPGTVLGSIDYIAPEQARDSTTIDLRADLYSLGATLYWCLTGKPPFAPQGTIALDLAIRQTQVPPSVATTRSGCARGVERGREPHAGHARWRTAIRRPMRSFRRCCRSCSRHPRRICAWRCKNIRRRRASQRPAARRGRARSSSSMTTRKAGHCRARSWRWKA